MSSRNDNSEMTGFAIVATGIIIMGVILFALAAFIALILTVLCVLAWRKPFKLGQHAILPYEAHAFVKGGLAGLWLVPAFALFCMALFHLRIADSAWLYLYLGGYVGGSFIGLWYVSENPPTEEGTGTTIVTLPPPEASHPEVRPFQFATWDDEEIGR